MPAMLDMPKKVTYNSGQFAVPWHDAAPDEGAPVARAQPTISFHLHVHGTNARPLRLAHQAGQTVPLPVASIPLPCWTTEPLHRDWRLRVIQLNIGTSDTPGSTYYANNDDRTRRMG